MRLNMSSNSVWSMATEHSILRKNYTAMGKLHTTHWCRQAAAFAKTRIRVGTELTPTLKKFAEICELIAEHGSEIRDCHLIESHLEEYKKLNPPPPPCLNLVRPHHFACSGLLAANAVGCFYDSSINDFYLPNWGTGQIRLALLETWVTFLPLAFEYRDYTQPLTSPDDLTRVEEWEWDPSWTTTATKDLARIMYESNDFSAIPILADALEEAGCNHEQLLITMRHRNCWYRGNLITNLILDK